MKRSTIIAVAAAALSTAAVAQVGTEPVENKVPVGEAPAEPLPPTDTPAPPTDDARPADRADAPPVDDARPADRADTPPATATPTPGDPASASGPPPKR